MNRRLRNALVVTTAGFLMTACEEGTTGASPSPSGAQDKTSTDSDNGGSKPTANSDSTSASGSGADSDSSRATGTGTDSSTEAGEKSGYGQSCGTNDLVWNAKEMPQAGGHYRISVKARSGITCVLPGGLPVNAFGSGGTQAGPAEQVAGD